ncbi:MAG: hypothetical protein Q8Q09_06940 [Deltaproteobacteria bacterium]|nr:hypothetical protein [Deltaproteobacteria bacterium]
MPRRFLVSVSVSTTTTATFSLGFATSSLPYAVTRLEGQTCEALPMGAAPVATGLDGPEATVATTI